MSSRIFLFRASRALAIRVLAVTAVTVGLSGPPTRADTLARQRIEAEELVREALSQEIYAKGAERHQLLARAVEVSPDQPGAHWHLGEVRIGNRWLPVTGPIENHRQRQLRETYEQRRSSAPDTVDGHLMLADWCTDHRLTAQGFAHLDRILQLEPDHPVARQRLGFQRVNGTWGRGQDLWQGLEQGQQTAESLRKWQRKVDDFRRTVQRETPALTAQSIARWKAALTADAVPALELLLGNDSELAAQAGIELLGSIQDHQAALALARQSVLSTWPEVRTAAARHLQTRPRDHYVPRLLAELSTPIESQYDAVLENGRIRYRHQFWRETQDRRKATVLDTVLDRRTGTPGPLAGEKPDRKFGAAAGPHPGASRGARPGSGGRPGDGVCPGMATAPAESIHRRIERADL